MELNGVAFLLLLVSSCAAGDSVLDDPESVLYVTTYRLGRRAGDIRALHLSSGTWSVIAGAVMAHDVALDEQSGYLYWATNERSAGVFRLNLRNAAPVEPVVTTGIGAGRRIAIDWLGRHLYVLDSGGVRIVACEMDGTNCVVVIKEDPIQMDGVDWCALALHPESRLMFWSDCSDHISSAGMDGTNRKVIVRGKISLAKGLVVDPALAGRIFWSDEKRSHIESCDLNGKNRLRSKVKTGAPYSIDVLQDTFFWSSPRSGKVFACDKSNCSVPVAVVTMAPASTPSFLYGIHVQHPSKQLRLTNPCSSSACSHACLLSPTSRSGFRCACPAGMELAADDSSCHDSRGHSSLLLSKGAHLFLLQRRLIGKDSLLQLPNPRQSSEDIGSIAYDASADSIVYSRCAPGLNSTSAIYSMNLQTKIEKLLFTGILGCSGFGVDPYTGNVYWTEMDRRQNGHGLVAKGSYYSGRTPQVLVARIESPAVDIVLAPDLHLMFIQTNQAIISFTMDGSNRKTVLEMSDISDLDYNGGYVYFATPTTMERIKADGSERLVLITFKTKATGARIAAGSKAVFLTRTGICWMVTSGSAVFQVTNSSADFSNVAVVEKWAFRSNSIPKTLTTP